jgi:hypothetical protein
VISYQWDHVKDLTTPVQLVQAQWTGRLFELDCAKLLELSSRGHFGNYFPRLMTCIAPVGVVDAIAERFGDIFGSVAPDYRFAYRCLAVCDTILYLDRSCLVEHGMTRSAGISYLRGAYNADAARFARELRVERFSHTPEPAFETVANALFEEYCAVRVEAGGTKFPEPDWNGYLTAQAISVDRIADPDWKARMQELLRRRGWTRLHSVRHTATVALEMAGYFARHPGALARSVKRQLWDRPPGTPLAFLLPKLGLDPRLRGELQFGSSTDALRHADEHPRPARPYAWHVYRLRRAGAIVSGPRRSARPAARLPLATHGSERDHRDP